MSMKLVTVLLGAGLVAGCAESFEGTRAYYGPDSVIATGVDKGRDRGVLQNGRAAIAYDPDGCQNWIIDDGLEGYSTPRFDPVSGLPICNDKYPPGTVLGDYQSANPGIRDRVSGPGRKTVVVRRTN
ncbi:hypothetical protein M3484_22390 [Pseudomonas sp. GX19020]|uniref:hypothetical protein n=2 Tax=Pseudomonadota TaxID=1224 RepID=UPI00089A1C00|nr:MULTISPECIES: hypothetical protein [Pseudomonadota]MCL4069311.1 hypothetical protein [Pseudomonas sp. GX19020]SEB48033.1 hypothetical protein SAMN05519105_0456 [Rhodobacter sp. 24-YEA-8]